MAGGNIKLESLTKRFDDVIAVDDISVEIRAGEFFSLLGPSGCGKTTTLRMIAGQLMFQTTSAATSAVVPRRRNVSSCVTNRNSPTASSSSGITNEKIITKFRPFEVRLRHRSIPIAKPTPIGTVISVVRPASFSVWMTAECSSGLCRTEVTWLPTYHLVEKPCQVACEAPLLNENSTATATGTIDQTM